MKALMGVLILVTAGSATQWHVLSHAGTEMLTEVQFADTLQGWTLARKDLLHTTDRGWTWHIDKGLGDPDFAGLAVTDSGHVFVSYGVVYVPRYVDWYVWIDEGVNGQWRNRYFAYELGAHNACRARRLSVQGTLHLWHLGWLSVAVRTRDGGGNWDMFDPYTICEDASFVDSTAGWACSEVVYKTVSAGDSWQALTPGLGARRIQMFDSLSGWVLSTSGLLRTTDGWFSWDTVVAEPGLTAMRFYSPRHGVAVGLGGVILHTTDAGVTWLQDTTESSLDLYAVWMVDSVHAWAAGDSGIVLGMGDWAMPGIEDRRQLLLPFRLAGVSPNPCRGTLWARCRGGPGSVVVYDDCGRFVQRVHCGSSHAEKLDLRRLPEGVYFVRAASSPGSGVRFVLLH